MNELYTPLRVECDKDEIEVLPKVDAVVLSIQGIRQAQEEARRKAMPLDDYVLEVTSPPRLQTVEDEPVEQPVQVAATSTVVSQPIPKKRAGVFALFAR